MATELPHGMTLDQASEWFGLRTAGRFNLGERVSQRWLDLGRFPELEAIEDAGNADLHRFADGTVLNGDAVVDGGGRLPAGLARERIAEWYGSAANDGTTHEFDENDPVCKLWLGIGRYPKLVWVDDFDDRTYFRFADGTVIFQPGRQSNHRILAAKTNGGLYPDGMDEGLAELWFGERFDADGPVSRLWLRVGQERKRFPRFLPEKTEQLPNGQFFHFADGSVFVRSAPDRDPTVFPVPQAAGGSAVIEIVKGYLHVPYVLAGIPERGEIPTGWDCSGMTYWLDQSFGTGHLPRGSHIQFQYAEENGLLFYDPNQFQIGDLIFFDTGNYSGYGGHLNKAGHVAVWMGDGKIIHAANPDEGTTISQYDNGYYAPRFIGAIHMSWPGLANQ